MSDRRFNDSAAAEQNAKKWYEQFPKQSLPCKHTKSEVEVLELKAEAKRYLEAETAAFQSKRSKSRDSEYEWLKTALAKGTGADKVAAGIVLIQENPRCNLARLASLVSQVRAAKHGQCSTIVTDLRDLFLSDLLHPDARLLKFEEQSLNEADRVNASAAIKSESNVPRNKLLAFWYFEDQLRDQYGRFVDALSAVASDTVDANREKAVSVMAELLTANAEQERKLLELLVNKIGDPSSKVASKTVFCLGKVLHEHPNMKLTVLREVEKLLFRKNVAQRAQYYAICLLTQFVLNEEDGETANTLIDVYFAFFKACLKRGEPDSRMMAALLTGVNRAYPFADPDTNKMQEHIDSVYKVVHAGSFNVALNALSLLHHVVGRNPAQSDRFYSAFYRKLADPQIGTANKRAMFLNLLFRVLRNDHSVTRLYAFLRRILQIAMYFPANMACATLYVLSKVLHVRKDTKHILKQMQTFFKREAEEAPGDAAIKSDVNSEDEDDEVSAKNEKEEDDGIMLSNVRIEPSKDVDEKREGSKLENEIKTEKDETKGYDPFCRNPLHARADKSLITELAALSAHFHPSVALFANTIVQGKPIDYSGDPLEDLTLIRFLDRYVFKNPKKLDSKKITKKNDPLAQRAAYIPKGVRAVPIDSSAYLNEYEDRIPVDELFLYKYMKNKSQMRGQLIKKEDEDEDDIESVNSDEFNAMMDGLGTDKDLDDFDVAADIGSGKSKKTKENTEMSDDDDDDQSDGVSDGGDDGDPGEEMDDDDLDEELGEDDDFPEMSENDDLDGIDEENLSVMEFDSDDDEIGDVANSSNARLKGKTGSRKANEKKTKAGRRKKSDFSEKVFVSAEEFAEMLEEQGRSKFKHGGTDAVSAVDGASVKQISWEMKRNQRRDYGRNKRKNSLGSRKNFKGAKKFKKR